MDGSRLESDLQEPFEAYRARPAPDTRRRLVEQLRPDIDRAIQAHVGRKDPLLRSRAKQEVLKGLPRFDPQKSGLRTFVHNQLQGLRRYAAQESRGVDAPQRVVLDKRALDMAHRELESELGRAPNDEELSQRSGLGQKRLAYVRGYNSGLPASAALESGSASFLPGADDASQAWVRLIYDESDEQDRKILEHTLGLNNQPRLGNQEIAKKLNRTPAAVSRRKAALQRRIDEEPQLSPFRRGA